MNENSALRPWRTFRRQVEKTATTITNYRHTDYGLLLASIAVGIAVGSAVVLFHLSMHFAEGVFNWIGLSANRSFHAGIYFFPLITALGGLGVGLLGKRVFVHAHEEGLHGVVTAIRDRGGKMHWISAVKATVSAGLSIGSGGGGGKEGPIILLGSSVGSTLGQIFNLKPEAMRTLCTAGAAAAISGIFNAPLAGLIFAIEAIYGEFVVGSFVSVVVASVLATVVRRVLLDNTAVIDFTLKATPTLTEYISIGLVGLSCGLISIYYLSVYRWISKQFTRVAQNVSPVLKPMYGGLAAGILAVALPTMLETSYQPVSNVIAGKYGLLLVIATFLIKPISNAVSLSSGGSGGTFAPAIKAGAMWGFFVASGLQLLAPGLSPGLLSVIGAACVLAGTWRIPLSAAILLCETTHNFEILPPLLFATILSVFVVEKFKFTTTFNPLEAEN